jgi:hypothetical protein
MNLMKILALNPLHSVSRRVTLGSPWRLLSSDPFTNSVGAYFLLPPVVGAGTNKYTCRNRTNNTKTTRDFGFIGEREFESRAAIAGVEGPHCEGEAPL